MSAVISIVVGIIMAMVAWAFFKSVIGAVFFGLILAGLIHWWQSRNA